MNDNLPVYEGPGHADCAALLTHLMLVLSNASRQGVERFDDQGEPVYDFGFWAEQCAMALAVDRKHTILRSP